MFLLMINGCVGVVVKESEVIIMEIIKKSELDADRNMIWLDDPTKYDYVRQSNYMCCSPNFKPIHKNETCSFYGNVGGLARGDKETPCIKKKGKLKLIGYSKPKKSMPSAIYLGVYFWLKPYDRGMPDEKLCYGYPYCEIDVKKWYHPHEAVRIINYKP